jgi:hypothetical protein
LWGETTTGRLSERPAIGRQIPAHRAAKHRAGLARGF